MSNQNEFPPKGFHIVRGVDTPIGPMDMLEENEGYKLRIPLFVIVEVDKVPTPQDPPAEL